MSQSLKVVLRKYLDSTADKFFLTIFAIVGLMGSLHDEWQRSIVSLFGADRDGQQ